MTNLFKFRYLLLISIFALVGSLFTTSSFARDYCTFSTGGCGTGGCPGDRACVANGEDHVCSDFASLGIKCDATTPICTPSNSCGAPGCNKDEICVSEWWNTNPAHCVQSNSCGVATNDPCPSASSFCKDPTLKCEPTGNGYICAKCASSSGGGLPAVCGGGNNSPICCGGGSSLTCKPVYQNGNGCATAPANTCGGNMGGGICWDNGQCASGDCKAGAGNVKHCTDATIPRDGACSLNQACRCASGTQCLDPDNNGSYTCTDPADVCYAPGPGCVPNGSKKCCDSGGSSYTCNIANGVPTCQQSSACVSSGSCSPGGTPCCQPAGHSVKCEFTGGGSLPFTCVDHSVCKTLGNTCNGNCCSGLKCVSGACVADTTGNECTGGGCDQCNAGYACHEGKCTQDPLCDLTIPYAAYAGPIINLQTLLARVYAVLYPVGIAIGLAFIIKAGYTLMTSEGNPQLVQQGQEELTSAVLGTFFILLSVVILRIIIKQILGSAVGF